MFSPRSKPVLIMAKPVSIEVSFAEELRLLAFPKHDTERKYTVVSPSKNSAISPQNGPVQALLPAVQTSSPLAILKLPEKRQRYTLPPLQTILAEISGSYNPPPLPLSPLLISRNELAWDHKRSRQFVPSQVTPSLYPHVSPASCEDTSAVSPPASQKIPQVRHTQSDVTCLTASKPPPSTVKGPTTGDPSPTDQTQVGERPPSSRGPQSVAPIPTDTFKCRHPGCTAGPFLTQYLMQYVTRESCCVDSGRLIFFHSSHAYVHSQDRPYFCPVEGCARGVDGKGFKRKNEVIRHGLVHNSPGYICPFCPGQGRESKYPRPDNLQR
jgi:hypothetical protein